MCRECFSEYNRKRYNAKREEIKAKVRAYVAANREVVVRRKHEAYWKDVERSRARARVSAAVQNARPERKAAKVAWARADRARNPEKWREKSRRQYRLNKQARFDLDGRRRAQKGSMRALRATPSLLRAKWSYWGGRCWMCGGTATEWDHVKPLSAGGLHCVANLRPACRSCNATKSNAWPWPRKED